MKTSKTTICFFTQLPPPVHGQSLMNEMVLNCLHEFPEFKIIQVPLDLSKSSKEVGAWRFHKLLQLWKIRRNLIKVIKEHQPDILYFVPAPPRLLPIFRDLFLLFNLKRKFPTVIFHIHGIGLGEKMIRSKNPLYQCLQQFYKNAIVWYLSPRLEADANGWLPSRTICLPNAIPDPFSDESVIQKRSARTEARAQSKSPFRFLFISSLSPQKGLYRAVDSVIQLANSIPHKSFEIHLAGQFQNLKIEAQFQADFTPPPNLKIVHLGFLDNEQKRAAYLEADCLLMPTQYPFEGAPLVIIEAMAAGCPVLASTWRGIPDLFPKNYPFDKNYLTPDTLITDFDLLDQFNDFKSLREHYLQLYSPEPFKTRLRESLAISLSKTLN